MAKKFSMKDLLNSKSVATDSGPKAAIEIELIDIGNIMPDDRNFYSVDDVHDLIDSISMVGLEQNLVVRKDPPRNGYTIISGHRRWKALQSLVNEGRDEFRMVPCKVSKEYGQVDDILTELRLIFGNATSRRLSDYERTQQAVRMKDLLQALKDNGIKIPGRLRDLIADTLKTSTSKVGRMENIAENLAPEFQDEFKSGGINMSVANELSGLPPEKQQEVYGEFKEKGSITVNEVRQHKTTTRVDAPPAPLSTPQEATPIPKKPEQLAPSPDAPPAVRVHDLKAWPEAFDAMAAGLKPWDYRRNDRAYMVGDILHQMRYDPAINEYTGHTLDVEVIYILHGGTFGIPEGYAIMSVIPREVDNEYN